MELQLENLKYQDTAIQAVIKVFDGTEKNTFDNACIEGIRSNFCKKTTNTNKMLLYSSTYKSQSQKTTTTVC